MVPRRRRISGSEKQLPIAAASRPSQEYGASETPLKLLPAFLSTSAAEILSRVVVLGTTVVTARALGPVQFGAFVGLWATAVIAATAWDLGTSTVMTREIAARRLSGRDAAGEAVRLRLLTLPLWAAVFAGGVIAIAGTDPSGVAIAAFIAMSLLSGARSLAGVFLQARLRFGAAGLALSLGRFAAAALSPFAFLPDARSDRLAVAAVALAVGEAVSLGIGIVAAREAGDEVPDGRRGRITLRASLPFAFNVLLATAYNRLDVLIVSALSSPQQLAAYAPASRMQDALYVLPAVLSAIALPTVARNAESVVDAAHVVRRLALGGIVLAVPVTTLLALFAPEIIATVLGGGYDAAVTPTRILALFLPFAALAAPPLAALAAVGRARDTMVVFSGTFVTAMAMHVILVPEFGAKGGAVASLLREPVALILTLVLARRAGLLYRGSAQRTTE